MKIKNIITALFEIEYPIIQGGMVWVSGWKLASAVSNAGGLGLIGAGSMKPDLLQEHILKCKSATNKSFGVNLPLLRNDINDLIEVVKENKIKIVFTSAGHPGRYIETLKKDNITVVHVISNVKQGLKSQSVGCDAVVGEGVEAGGHNGPDELTTFTLIPQLVDALEIPVIAAGGIADGRTMMAAFALGAQGVQIGTRFAASQESSAHENYKKKIIESHDNDTILVLKKIGMVRIIKNNFSNEVLRAEQNGASEEKLKMLLDAKREMKGIFLGNEHEGMMEAGQSSGLISSVEPVEKIFASLIELFDSTKRNLSLM